MANLMATMQVVGAVMGVAGAAQEGNAKAESSEFERAQMEQLAQQERVAGERAGKEERRQGDLLISKARAAGAASGGGVDVKGLGDLDAEAELRARTRIWEGEEKARFREDQANEKTREAGRNRKAGRLKAARTLVAGATSFYDAYA